MELNVLQTSFETLILFYYTFILLTIATSKEKVFCSGFYTLFVSTGVTDIVSLLLCFALRLNIELSLSREFPSTILYCLAFSRAAYVAHLIGNTFITFNRYSSICLMHRYKKIWTRRNVLIIVAIQYAVSVATVPYTVTSKIVFSQSEDGTYTFRGLEPHVAKVMGSISLIIAVACSSSSLVMNVRLLIGWRNLLKERDRSTTSHAEKGLLMYTITVFSIIMVMCTEDTLLAVSAVTENYALFTWVTDHLFLVIDFMVSAPPLFLLLLSPDLRLAALNIIHKPKPLISVIPFSRVGGGQKLVQST